MPKNSLRIVVICLGFSLIADPAVATLFPALARDAQVSTQVEPLYAQQAFTERAIYVHHFVGSLFGLRNDASQIARQESIQFGMDFGFGKVFEGNFWRNLRRTRPSGLGPEVTGLAPRLKDAEAQKRLDGQFRELTEAYAGYLQAMQGTTASDGTPKAALRTRFQRGVMETLSAVETAYRIDLKKEMFPQISAGGNSPLAWEFALNEHLLGPYGRRMLLRNPENRHVIRPYDIHYSMGLSVRGHHIHLSLADGYGTCYLPEIWSIVFNMRDHLPYTAHPNALYRLLTLELDEEVGHLMDALSMTEESAENYLIPDPDLAPSPAPQLLTDVMELAGGLRGILTARDLTSMILLLEHPYKANDPTTDDTPYWVKSHTWAKGMLRAEIERLLGTPLENLPEEQIKTAIRDRVREDDLPRLRLAALDRMHRRLRLPAHGADPGGEGLPTLSPDGRNITEPAALIQIHDQLFRILMSMAPNSQTPGGPRLSWFLKIREIATCIPVIRRPFQKWKLPFQLSGSQNSQQLGESFLHREA